MANSIDLAEAAAFTTRDVFPSELFLSFVTVTASGRIFPAVQLEVRAVQVE